MPDRQISATEFKAKCLALLDEVEASGEAITVIKRGRAVATLQGAKKRRWKSSEGSWVGKVEITGDIINFNTAGLWDGVEPPPPRKRRSRSP